MASRFHTHRERLDPVTGKEAFSFVESFHTHRERLDYVDIKQAIWIDKISTPIGRD